MLRNNFVFSLSSSYSFFHISISSRSFPSQMRDRTYSSLSIHPGSSKLYPSLIHTIRYSLTVTRNVIQNIFIILIFYNAQEQRIEDTNYSSYKVIHNMFFENKRRKKEHIITSQHAKNIDLFIEKDHFDTISVHESSFTLNYSEHERSFFLMYQQLS